MLAFEVCPLTPQITAAYADYAQDENQTDDHAGHHVDNHVSGDYFHHPVHDKPSQPRADRVRV